MRKIGVVTGTRAEYGIFKSVLQEIEARKDLKLSLIVIGMHLSPEFGFTVKEIEEDGFEIEAKIDVLHAEDTKASMAKSIGESVSKIAETLEELEPDVLLVLGDRSEMLAGAVAATYMGIPIGHIHGGEVSGNVDEPVRHAITKLAHLHFPATKEGAERILKMGEEAWRVHVVGAPSLDLIVNKKIPEPKAIADKYRLDLSKPILLVLQHPVVAEADEAASQIRKTLEAVKKLKQQTVLIYPNADAGGRRMIEVIRKYEDAGFLKTFKSVAHEDYLGLMRLAKVMIGNSSSGIIEAPSFGLPVVNIGGRQEGRQRAGNVIEVRYDTREIVAAVKKALQDRDFRKKVSSCENPYGDGKAGKRIVKVLSKVELGKKLLEKRMTY
jgi:UDP-N-acetylglucosamine 2-epimerase (non-hydrolysing)/GDP/UDP-N,N'-diacetylbacillosamine 2-epimerase (hydrolysing)